MTDIPSDDPIEREEEFVPDANPSFETIVPEVEFVLPPVAFESIDTALPPSDGLAALIPTHPAVDLAPVTETLAALGRKIDAMQTLFEREIRAESVREKVVDRLHAELQEYKQGLLLGILKPVFIDLIQLHDDVGKMLGPRDDESAPIDPARVRGLLEDVRQGIEDILYRQGVEPFETEEERFDPRRQRAVSTVPTENSEQVRSVARRLRKGFVSGDKIIRPEVVSVFAIARKSTEQIETP